MANLKLSPPWLIYYKEIQAFFKEDPGVRVIFDSDNYEIKLYVDNPKKAEALSQILIPEKEFGNVTEKVIVVPANNISVSKASLFQAAFDGNEAVNFIYTVKGVFSNELTYIGFRNKVVQYYTDDLSDFHGLHSTLYQDIAKDIFTNTECIYFCTDIEDDDLLGMSW